MSISKLMQDIIKKELDDRASKGTKRQVSYTVETQGQRTDADIATISFKFNKPIANEEARVRSKNILRDVADSLDLRKLGVVDAILSQYALRGKVGRKRTSGNVQVRLGDYLEEGRALGINTVSGKLISENNLKGLLELVAKDYLIRDMKNLSAPLKYRTGRFANSLDVRGVRLLDNEKGRRPEMSIFYTYMTYPYATFDPKKSSRPEMYRRPFYGARNPQKHIGSALAKAARDIIHSRYNIQIKEAAL